MGSANGKEHGGIVMPTPYWDTPWNVDKTVEAVREMAAYAADKGDVLYGIQVINEPQYFDHDIHNTLDNFYHRAILEVRNYLPADVPVVVFEWANDFNRWPNDRYPEWQYGKVIWDTHIYTTWNPQSTVEATMDLYWNDMLKLETFHNRQGGGAFVGEWALAGTNFNENAEWYRRLAEWVVFCIMEGSHGAVYWNLDAPSRREWSFERVMNEYGVDWLGMPKPGPRLPALVPSPLPTPAPTPAAIPGCVDANQNCEMWAASGECASNPAYMLVNCRKSCGVCPPAPTPAPTPLPTPAPTPAAIPGCV